NMAEGATGPAGIVFPGGLIWLAIGGAGPATPLLTPLPNENSLVRITPLAGIVTKVADLGAYERANNPEPTAVDSNLYGPPRPRAGSLYVADAGGTDLSRVAPPAGQLTLVPVFPHLTTPPGAPAPPQLEPVPTGVAPGPDGSVYVGFLTGGPFPPGA